MTELSVAQILKKHGILTVELFDALDISGACYDALYERLYQEMPYGTAKARTGDPYQWIQEHVYNVMDW